VIKVEVITKVLRFPLGEIPVFISLCNLSISLALCDNIGSVHCTEQTLIYKTLHRKLTIVQYDPEEKLNKSWWKPS
jgi:hypothetical protein